MFSNEVILMSFGLLFMLSANADYATAGKNNKWVMCASYSDAVCGSAALAMTHGVMVDTCVEISAGSGDGCYKYTCATNGKIRKLCTFTQPSFQLVPVSLSLLSQDPDAWQLCFNLWKL